MIEPFPLTTKHWECKNTKLPSCSPIKSQKDLQNKTHSGHTHAVAPVVMTDNSSAVCVLVIWENIISNMVIHCTEAHWERKEQLWSACACAVCVSVIHSFYQWRQSWILFITLGRWSQSHLTYFYLEANALCSIVICRLWAWYEARSSWRIVGRYFSLHHTKELELNFKTNSTKNSSHPKKMLMSPRRIMVLITSVFRLIVFLWGLCLLIMPTNRSGNSNYFLDWGQNPCIQSWGLSLRKH